MRSRLPVLVVLMGCLWIQPAWSGLQEEDEPIVPHQGQEAAATNATAENEADAEVSVVETRSPNADSNPREIRLHLWDGSVIAGELSITHLPVHTEFGDLQVPIEKIVSLRPGLESIPQKREQIESLIESLGSDDYKTREDAHKELVAMGLLLRHEIYRFEDGGNAERKRHLEEIRKDIETMIDELDEVDSLDGDVDAGLIQGDTVATPDFVIVGKIGQDSFQVSSKYGPLTVQLGDVQYADRDRGGSVQRRSSVSLSGKNFAHANPKSSGIRVQRGDRISIRADGQITMSPWGMQAAVTPDGNLQYGNFNGHGGGTLLALIGDGDDYIKVGTKATFTASRAGVLKLGIAIQPEYANESYQFPGSYKARIVIESAAE